MGSAGDTIAAVATGRGGAIAMIRVSGPGAMEICRGIFSRDISSAPANSLHHLRITDPERRERVLDDVVVSVFRAPHSYTGEDSVEIACHASEYIVGEIMRLLTCAGARNAEPGEFTLRAFLNGKIDLAQAEAVADIIASQSAAAHAIATTQMRGGYSRALGELRSRLLSLTALLELELDFSEEDVEFADRSELRRTMESINTQIDRLAASFALGNAIKDGVAVAIVGAPNVGKSTLLNRLIGENRAMVSEIAGTTRDTVEEKINIDGVTFRFIDTAGLHETTDRLERMGMQRTAEAMAQARIVVQLAAPPEGAGTAVGAAAPAAARVAGTEGLTSVARAADSDETDTEGARAAATESATEGAGTAPAAAKVSGTEEAEVAASAAHAPVSESTAAAAGEAAAADGAANVTWAAPAAAKVAGTEVAEVAAPAAAETAGTAAGAEGLTSVAHASAAAETAGTAAGAEGLASAAHAPVSERTAEAAGVIAGEVAAAGFFDIELTEGQRLIRVLNKADRGVPTGLPEGVIAISALRGDGVERLLEVLRGEVDTQALYAGDAVVSSARHRAALEAAGDALRRAMAAMSEGLPADLLCEDIRQVIHHLGTITGEITDDEILGHIFSRFCVGK